MSHTPPTCSKLRRWIVRVVIAWIILLVVAELIARFTLGLGDPPLMMTDPHIEYLYQPSKSYHRFGNRIWFNAYSMRSDEFAKSKTDRNEIRLMLLGDSVINGTAWIDQAEIASEIIKRRLQRRFESPVVVGNISAGSWGPPNLLAYVKRFGLFDADVVVIVLSSHDASDTPTFGLMGVDAPQHKPFLALQEAVQRYLPRYLPDWMVGNESEPSRTAQHEGDRIASLAALRELIDVIHAGGAHLIIAQHLERTEIESGPQPGHADIAKVADELGVSRHELGPAFAESLSSGENPYRDNIHPNSLGQQLLANAIFDWIESTLANESRQEE